MNPKTIYGEKLKDPRWQKKRLKILERDGFRCVSCKCEHKTLHIHHMVYADSGNPWDALDGDLKTLCWPCHWRTHCQDRIVKAINDFIDEIDDGDSKDQFKLLRSWIDLLCNWIEKNKLNENQNNK